MTEQELNFIKDFTDKLLGQSAQTSDKNENLKIDADIFNQLGVANDNHSLDDSFSKATEAEKTNKSDASKISRFDSCFPAIVLIIALGIFISIVTIVLFKVINSSKDGEMPLLFVFSIIIISMIFLLLGLLLFFKLITKQQEFRRLLEEKKIDFENHIAKESYDMKNMPHILLRKYMELKIDLYRRQVLTGIEKNQQEYESRQKETQQRIGLVEKIVEAMSSH